MFWRARFRKLVRSLRTVNATYCNIVEDTPIIYTCVLRTRSYGSGMAYSEYTKQRILSYWFQGQKAASIALKLKDEGIIVSRVGVWKFVKRYQLNGTIHRRPGSGRPSKITADVLRIVDAKMAEDDETTAVQLQKLLAEKGHQLSLHTILRSRTRLGWTFRGSAYCQLIRDANKVKRLEWARQYLQASQNDGFRDVVWTDECTVQLETHRRHSCRRKGQLPRPKPR